MPRYDYDCAACGARFEVMHGVHADGPVSCPLCDGGPVRKAISAASVHFKGSGWAKKERHATARSAASSKSDEDSSSDNAPDSGSEETTKVAEPALAKAPASGSDGPSKPSKPSKPADKPTAPAAD